MQINALKALGYTIFFVLTLTGCIATDEPNADTYFQHKPQATAHAAKMNDSIYREVEHSIQRMLSTSDVRLPSITAVVADFVTLTANYDQPSLLGRYLAQAYITGLHKVGVQTLEYQATGDIRVTPNGNLGLSQDYLELDNKINANAILVGTITPDKNGYDVHARLVDNASKKILGASQFYLHKDIARSIHVDRF